MELGLLCAGRIGGVAIGADQAFLFLQVNVSGRVLFGHVKPAQLVFHAFLVAVTAAAQLLNVPTIFEREEPGFLRMDLGNIGGRRIAAVAIVAAEPFLPVDVTGQVFFGDVKSPPVAFPEIRLAMAQDAFVFLHHRRRNVFARWRRRSLLDRLGGRGFICGPD